MSFNLADELLELESKGTIELVEEKGTSAEVIPFSGVQHSMCGIGEQVSDSQEGNTKTVLTVEEILNIGSDDTTWIVEGIIPEGGIVLLSAPPSNFKTWFALQTATCVAEGKSFLNREVNKKKVYYIDRENPPVVFRRYFEMLGVSKDSPLNIWPSWVDVEPAIFTKTAYDAYKDIAKEKPLIVFDSLIRFYPKGIDENQSTHIAPIMDFLKSLTKLGATIILLHHAGKAEGSHYRGSSDILGGVDMAYSMKKSAGGTSLDIKCIKSRYGVEENLKIEVISDDNSLSFEDITHKKVEERKEAEKGNMSNIRALIEEIGRPNQTDICKVANEQLNITRNQTLSLLKKGDNKFWITESEGLGRATYYRVTCPPVPDI